MEGFIVCPPLTTTSTPSDSRIEARPDPAATATKPIGLSGPASGAGVWRAAAASAASPASRVCDCRRMLWMCTSETSPSPVMYESTEPGSLVCTWTLNSPPEPTTSSLPPTDAT